MFLTFAVSDGDFTEAEVQVLDPQCRDRSLVAGIASGERGHRHDSLSLRFALGVDGDVRVILPDVQSSASLPTNGMMLSLQCFTA